MKNPYINPVTNHEEILRLLTDMQKHDIERIRSEKIEDHHSIDRSVLNFN